MATISKKQKLTAVVGSGYQAMSKELQDKLIGKSLNQAIAEGLITELGDGDGNLFAVSDKDFRYALVNNQRVSVSKALNDADTEDVMSCLGDLTFNGGISTIEGEGLGKYWFNLGMPRTMTLTADTSVNINTGIAVG